MQIDADVDTDEADKRMRVTVPKGLHDKLHAKKQLTGHTLSEMLTHVLEDWDGLSDEQLDEPLPEG